MKTPFHGALTLLIFLLTIICTYALVPQGLRVRIPRTGLSVPVSFCWVPWLATAILLIFQAITFADVGSALAGDGALKPSSVVVMYLSLAYLAVSCEITGLYSWLALHVARLTRGRAPFLVAACFCLTGLLTATTGPDVSLVALTPMTVYMAGASNLDPMSMAATHMGAASVWGMLVQSAGLVNIITSHAFQLSFLRFLGWMALPTCAAAMVLFGLLYGLLHRRRVAHTRHGAGTGTLPYPEPGVMLHDQVGAACISALLCGCLLALAVAPWLRWSGWLVTAVFAIVAALYNLAASWGPLRTAIGRRSAYERRRRLQAELAQQGLHRVMSDEDLADLLLSAAQHRQASFTRLAAAAASRVTASPSGRPLAAATDPGAPQPQPSQPSQPQPQQQQASWPRRPSANGLGSAGGADRSSANGFALLASGSLSHSLPSGASIGSGAGGSGSGFSPVRHWFSRRWSSFRGWSLPPQASTELVEAAADAGADLGILGECGVLPVVSGGWSGAAQGSTHGAACAAAAAAAPAAATVAGAAASAAPRTDRTVRGVGDGSGSTGPVQHSVGAASSAGAAGVPRLSGELHQLLTHGTSAAPDTLEWWAAAARGAIELLHGSGKTMGPGASVTQSPWTAELPFANENESYQIAVSANDRCVRGLGNGAVQYDSCGNPQGTAPVRRGACDGCGSLTRASAFAAPSAMTSPGWDGRMASASAYWDAADAGTAADAGEDARHVPAGADTGGVGGSAGSGGGFWRLGSHRRQRSYDSVHAAAAKQRAWGSQARGVDPRGDICGAADSGGGQSGGRSKGFGGLGFGGGWRSVSLGRASCRRTSDGGGLGLAAGQGAGGTSSSGSAAFSRVRPFPLDPMRESDQRPTAVTARHGPDQSGQPAHQTGSPKGLGDQTHGSLSPRSPRLLRLRPWHPQQPHQQKSQSPGAQDDVAPVTPAVNFRSFHCSDDCDGDRGSDHSDLAAVLLAPAELDGVADGIGPRAGAAEAAATSRGFPQIEGGGGGTEEAPQPPTQAPGRPMRPSLLGFGGLLSSWRRGGKDAEGTTSECTALLAGRVVASDDYSHVSHQVPLPPLPPAAAATTAPLGEKPSDPLLRGQCLSVAVQVYNEHGNGDAAASAASARLPPVSAYPGSLRQSPFSVVTGDTLRRGFAEDIQVGGGGGGSGDGGGQWQPGRCDSLGPSGSTASWGHYKLRRPSVALLLVGSGEVSFVGTFLALPWANAVLLLGWFVLVEALQVHGWLDSLANALTAIADYKDPIPLLEDDPDAAAADALALASGVASDAASPAGVAGAVFALGWLAVLLSLGMTGQTAALLLSRIMMRPEFLTAITAAAAASAATAGGGLEGPDGSPGLASAASPGGPGGGVAPHHVSPAHRGAQLALVVAASMAPALSLSGSLTALRWGLGLKDLGVRMRCCRYMVSGLAPAALAGTAAALLVLWAQCVAWQ